MNTQDPGPATGSDGQATPNVQPVALAALLLIAVLAVLALALTAGRYGYHRDELYFIAAGAHPAWGYPDQPLLTPLLAHAMNALAPDSLLLLRAPAILASGLTTLATGLLARELGGGRRAQALAAACWAAGAVCLVTGHFLTTTTYDVCATAIVSLLIVRLLRTGNTRLWLPAGAVLGLALLNKSLIAIVIGMVVVGLAVLGPRDLLRSKWFAAGVALAILGALPYGLWQIAHGLPQRQLADSIASSGDQGGRAGFIPFQLLLIGPLLAPVWIWGLVTLLRNPQMRSLRCFAVAYLGLIPLFIVVGGKAYYVAGLYPVLLAAGSVRVEGWTLQRPLRVASVGAAVVGTAAISAVIGLSLLPADQLQGSVVMTVNPDTGEMVGWQRFVDSVAVAYRSLPPARRQKAAIFTQNYGEAGAISKFGPAQGMPTPYSGHNGWALWGPPPDTDTAAVVVGLDPSETQLYFRGCRVRARIDNGVGLNNDEQGRSIWTCSSERRPWSALWNSLRHYD